MYRGASAPHCYLSRTVELALDQFHLRAACAHDRVLGKSHVLKLTEHTLQHGAFFPVLLFLVVIHQFDILLGA